MLAKVTETHIVDTENEAQALINSAKESSDYDLVKYSSEYKEKKDYSFYRVTLVKNMNGEEE